MIRALQHGSRQKRRLALLTLASAVALVLLGVVGLVFAVQTRTRFTTITHDSVPSIIAAQNLRADVEDMDADLANEVLENGNKGPQGEDWGALRSIAARRAVDDMARAYANVTFAGECQAITVLQNGLIDYTSTAGQVEQTIAQNPGKVGDPSNPASVQLYNKTGGQLTVMDTAVTQQAGRENAAAPRLDCTGLDPASAAVSSAGGLYTVNNTHEDQAYTGGRKLIGAGIGVTIVLGLLVLSVLYFANVRFAGATHRRFNPGLLAGAAVAIVLALFCAILFARLYTSFKLVSKDSLDSIRLALEIKASANLANAEESRWLFDKPNQPPLQQDFDKQSAAVKSQIVQARDNITFAGERTAIDGTEQTTAACQGGLCGAWNQYLNIDQRIRAMESSGNHAGAIQLNLGDSNTTFTQFTNNVNKLQQVNFDEYNKAASSSQRNALIAAIVAIVLGVAGAAAIISGVSARLREL